MRRRSTPTDLALIAVFAAVIAAFTLTPAVPVGIGVPITLQTLAVALTALVLGAWRGFSATMLYLIVGFAGLPVFAQGSAGLAVFGKPSIGYLLAFPLAALLTGYLAQRILRANRRLLPGKFFLAAWAGSLVFIHPMGILGMMINANLTLGKAFMVDLIYWPGDIVKCGLAAVVAAVVHRTFPALLATRVARVPVAEEL